MKSWLLGLAWLLSSCLGYQLPVEMSPPAADSVRPSGQIDTTVQRHEAVIEYATVDDDTLALYIEGYFPTDCDLPPNVEWHRRGTTLRAEVFYVAGPGHTCKRQRVYFEETVAGFGVMAAELTPGEYRLEVNGYRTWFRVPVAPPPTRQPPKTPIPPPPPDDEVVRAYAVIEDVDVIVLESYPMQVHLQVRGYHGNGCRLPTHIEQYREGRDIYVDIYRLVDPRIMCPAIIEYFDEVIVLRGGFRSGTYTIHVNDFVLVLKL